MIKRGLAVLGWLMLGLTGLFLVCCVAGELRQRILVHRASRLLADMHRIELHKSTWADAQKLMIRWGRWGHYEGTCTAEDCLYVVTLSSGSVVEGQLADWPSRTQVLLAEFRLLPRQWGGGLRQIQTMFLVQDHVIKRTGYAIDMTVSPLASGVQPACCGDELIISTLSRSSLEDMWQWEESYARHPDYKVWRPGGCTFCLMGRVTYPAALSSKKTVWLSDFQLNCATRWSSCLTLEQLDPAAKDWRLYGPPWGEAPDEEDAGVPPDHCPIPLYARARDAESIELIEALSNGVSQRSDTEGVKSELVPARWISSAKAKPSVQDGQVRRLIFSGEAIDGKVMRQPVHPIKGRRYFVLSGFISRAPRAEIKDKFDPCEVVEATAGNEEEIGRGVALDDPIRGPEVTVSLRGFTREQAVASDH